MYPKLLVTFLAIFIAGPASATFSGYTYKKPLFIQKSKVPNSDRTDFPVLISTTIANLKTAGNGGHLSNSSGYDLIFSTNSDCSFKLNWDTETYNASTGNLIAWVRLPTVFTASNTTFYMCYGNSAITSYAGASTATWDSNFKGVWHLPDGSSLTTKDSTSNANNGTNHSATAATGQIDGGGGFVSGSSQYIVGANTLNPTTVTVSAWVNVSAYPATKGLVIGFMDGLDNGTVDKDLYIDSAGKLNFYIYDGAVKTATSSGAIGTGAWVYLAGVSDGTNLIVYINGASAGSVLAGTSFGGYTVPNMFINGSNTPISVTYLTATMDEARISSTGRSADWLATEYNNQSAPNTFIVSASEISSGGDATLLHGVEF